MHTNGLKRVIALLLALAVMGSVMPPQAFAAGTDPHDHSHAEESLLQQIQEQSDALLIQHLGSASVTEVQAASAVEAMDYAARNSAKADIRGMLEPFSQLTEEELQLFGVLNPGFVAFADTVMVPEPTTIMPMAASGQILNGQITVSDTASNVSVSGNTATVTVTGSGGLTSGKTASNTVTVTNSSGSTAMVSFDYSCTATGTFTFSENTPGSYSGMLAAGASVSFTMSATGGALFSSSKATLTLSNFTLTTAQDSSNVTVSFDSAMGSVTAGGTAISSGTTLEGITPATGVALKATPASGHGFACWVNAADNSILSYAASYTLQPERDVSVKAVFFKTATDAYFSINKILYYSLNDALAAAKQGDVIVLANNGTLAAGDYTIPTGLTLLIPFEEDGIVYTTTPGSTSTSTTPSAYRTLTMASGANLTVNGTMNVNARHNRNSGRPVEKYGYVVMQEGSSIKVNGKLYAYGFISGKGTVKIMSGASVYEYFQIIDFRGGTATLNMYNNSNEVFPLSQYYVQNVEAPMTLEAGATEYGYTTLYMNSTEYHSTVKFIGTSGAMFNLTSGSVTKQYDGTSDRLLIRANGTMSLDPLSLSVSTMSINSKDYVLPINSSITIELEGGTVTINQDLALQPDSRLVIHSGARCTLASGVRLYVYDVDQWGSYVYSAAKLRVVPYAPGRTYKSATSSSRTVANDASIQVAGTLDASSGKLYTTAGGAAITGTEGGMVKMASVSSGNTYQATQSGTSVSYDTIAVTSAKLQNVGGTYVATSAGTYSYENGTWAISCDHSYSASRTEPTCTEEGTVTYTCGKCGRSYSESIPATGHSWNQGTVTTPAGCETAGVLTTSCTACGNSYTTPIDALGHDMVYSAVKEPTCTQDGESASAYCSRCDYVEVSGNLIPALGHDWTVSSRVEATCTEDGSIRYTCSRCQETKSETIPATGHSYSSTVTAPTCTEQGYTTHTCSLCGHSYTDSTVPATGHDYGDGSVVKIPECTTPGIRAYTCANCGDYYEDAIPELGHDLTRHTAKLASYTSVGWDAYEECGRCGHSTYREYPILARKPVSDYETFLDNLLILEQIADSYVTENPGEDPVALVLNYIRTGIASYTTTAWKIMAGNENTDFTAYVLAYEDAYNTLVTEESELISVVSIRDIKQFPAPSDPAFALEFTHMFGTMDITKHNEGSRDHADVAGWSGDLVDLLDLVDGKAVVTEKPSVEEMVTAIFANDYIAGAVESFGRQDMYGDLDAFYIMKELENREYYTGLLTQILKDYFVQGLTDESRAAYFIANRLNGITNRRQLRDTIYQAYAANKVNMTLEGTRTFTSDSEKRYDLRMACCYAFADYLWQLSGDYVEDSETGSLVITHGETVTLAPGIAQQVNTAVNAEGRSIRYYTATADLNRDDVRIDSAPGSGTVLALAQGYDANVIAAVNAGAIAKGGSYADSAALEATLSGNPLLQDGRIVAGDTEAAPGTAVGITKTGKALFVTADSATQKELAQILLNAGCVTAFLLTGTGDAYVSRQETEDIFTVHTGGTQKVSSVLLMISDAADDSTFHHAVLRADHTYLTANASVELSAQGVTARGTEVAIPEGTLSWSVSDSAIGAVDADGVFTATAIGDVEVTLKLDSQSIGSLILHVVTPDTLYFTESNINAYFGEPARLPLAALYNRKPVAIAPADVVFQVSDNDGGIPGGTVSGFDFTGAEASGLKTVTITATLAANSTVSDTLSVTMYDQGEVVFDFGNITGGDRRLAWLRQVSNATTEDDNTYHVVDPDKAMTTEYTLAIDMSAIEVPEQLKDLTSMLPGADSTDGTAWGFLLQLADRVSDLSVVRAEIQFDPNTTVDLSGLSLQNEYFDLTDVSLEEETNILTVQLKWRKQSASINPASANPVCVVSGIRQTPKADAAWDNNTLTPVNSGTLSYRFYLSAGALYTFANDPANQALYGLTPYINPSNSSDRGASFGADYASFQDSYTLVNALKNGWYFEDGRNVFYVDGVLHTEHQPSESVTTAPTCTEGGYTTHVCAVCGITYVTDETAPLGHTEETIPGKAPTCTDTGLTDGVKCSVCGEIITAQQVIPAKGHTEETIPGKAPTCTDTGLTDGVKCSVCDEILTAQQVIPANGHTEETIPGKAPTCTDTGLTDGVKCSTCDVVLTEQKVIPANGHTEETVPGKAPTCTDTGLTDGVKCSVCGETLTEQKEIPANGHTEEIVPGKAPTCTETGLTNGVKCSVCGETLTEQRVIPANDHTEETIPGKAPTCTATGLTDGVKCSVCGVVLTAQNEIPANGHTEETIPGMAPTCTETGLTDGVKCDLCGEIITAQQVIPANGHTEETVPGKAPTCTETGLTDGVKCSVCDEILTAQQVIPANGHTEETVTGKAPTCTDTGLTDGVKCAVCGETLTEQKVIPANGHTEETVPGKAPTCTETGLTDGVKCSVCGVVLTAQNEIPANGHTEETIPGKAPTCTETGLTDGVKCSVCGETLTEQKVIPANGHTEETVPGKAPTCTETGLTDGVKCAVCGEIITAQQVIPANGHTEETVPGKAPTCTETGLTDGVKCSVCGVVLTAQNEIPANGHTEETIPGKAPTCTETGLTDGVKCSVCGETLTEQKVIPANGHTEETVPGKAPTCTETGLTDGVKCAVCGEIITAQQVIPANGHTEETIPGKAPTCTATGLTEGKKCSVCGETLIAQQVIPATGHTEETVPGKAPTCTDTGLTEGKKCSVCGVVLTAQNEIPANGHTEETVPGKAPTCTETGLTDGVKCSVCGVILTEQEEIPANGHTEETIPGKAPTCTDTGLTDGVKCSVCGKTLTEQKEIPANGHTEETVPGKVPTCTDTGLTDGVKCSVCDEILTAQQVIPANGHTEETIPGKAPTCTETGLTEGKKCSVCGEIITAQQEIPANGHTEETVPGKAPTCTETGLTDGVKCSVCGVVLTAQQVIPAKGHTEETIPGKSPTCTETGLTEGKKCSVCGVVLTKQEVIPANGHTEETVPGKAPSCTETGLTEGKKCSVCGVILTEQEEIPTKGHDFNDGKCTVCGASDPDYQEPTEPTDPTDPVEPEQPALSGVIRIAGADRIGTSLMLADQLKEVLGVEKFDAVVVASALNFPDALTGSYLAAVKNAPILLTYEAAHAQVRAYIQENLIPDGMVYILGGEGAVSASFASGLNGFNVKRVAGSDRFGTNLEIMKEAGVRADQPVLIATAINFADSLSASAAGLPMVLVYGSLRPDQKEFLATTSKNFIIIGGTSAVSEELEAELRAIGSVERLAGAGRYQTSVMVAQKFVQNPDDVVLAYARNFPDGLCGGPLAYALGAPLILTDNYDPTTADAYVEGITAGIVVGGDGLISDGSVREIFDLAPGTAIRKK